MFGKQRGQQGAGKEINREFDINIYTLLYMKQVTNKNLLYTRNFTPYSEVTYMGIESKKSGYMYN